MPVALPGGTKNHGTSDSDSANKPSNDGSSLVDMNKMARKMSSMRITGKEFGGRVCAAPLLSDDVERHKQASQFGTLFGRTVAPIFKMKLLKLLDPQGLSVIIGYEPAGLTVHPPSE